MIRHFVQGQEGDQEIFRRLGPWLTDARIHKWLGYAITSADGDDWWISIDDSENKNGFAQVRRARAGWHIRYLYGLDDHAIRSLVERVILAAGTAGAKIIYTNDREDSAVWPAFGFAIKPMDKPRGSFRRWEKFLEGNK